MAVLPSDATLWSYAPDTAAYAAAGVPSWLDELDLSPAEPHVKMGTRSLSVSEIFLQDPFRDNEVALRNRLLDEQPDVVFAALSTDPVTKASDEVLALVSGWLAERNLPVAPPARHPLERAGRAVQEDLCLMVRRDGRWHLDAAVLCFPSLWSLRDKVGLALDDVHLFVPHYAADVSARVNLFLDRMRPGTAVWRRNLSVKPYPLLFLPMTKAEQLLGGPMPSARSTIPQSMAPPTGFAPSARPCTACLHPTLSSSPSSCR
jgi:hypothetical protein